jgi:protein phosphatase
LVEAGHITEEEAEQHTYKNVILQALGAQLRVNVIVDKIRLKRGDLLLLCSDGLSGKVKGVEMLKLIQDLNWNIRESCDALIKLANERGGEDNITVLIARFDGESLEEVKPEDPSKGEFVARDSNLPDEVDANQLTFGDEQTLQPEEDVISKVRERERSTDVVETQEVQATMLNMQAITPQMLAQMSATQEATPDDPVVTASATVSTAVENPTPVSSSSSSSTQVAEQEETEVEYKGNSSRSFTLVVVLIILLGLIAYGIYYVKHQQASAPAPAPGAILIF